jgi:hypothetical protein
MNTLKNELLYFYHSHQYENLKSDLDCGIVERPNRKNTDWTDGWKRDVFSEILPAETVPPLITGQGKTYAAAMENAFENAVTAITKAEGRE